LHDVLRGDVREFTEHGRASPLGACARRWSPGRTDEAEADGLRGDGGDPGHDYLNWPGVRQPSLWLERTWREHGQAKWALHYGITSLAPEVAGPARLLALRRGHWTIENRLHRRKGVTFGEDASLTHVA
jgi:hypothetical protein